MPVENQQQMMVVEGMVRGVGFNVNRLVHLPDWAISNYTSWRNWQEKHVGTAHVIIVAVWI